MIDILKNLIISLGIFLGFLNPPVGAATLPISAVILGENKTFSYANETANEDLIIRLEKQNFDIAVAKPIAGRPADPVTARGRVYVAVTNASGIAQNVNLTAVTGGKTMISYLAEVDATNAKAITARRSTRPANSKRKAVTGTEINVGDPVPFAIGETKYFLMEFRAAMANGETEEFFIEAYGDNNAYGHSF
mgnify:CR=1 FL=1